MPITLRLRDVSRQDELCLREAVESGLAGNWCVTVSRSHLDGLWHLQIQGVGASWRLVVASFNEASLTQLSDTLKRLAPGNGQRELPLAPADLSGDAISA